MTRIRDTRHVRFQITQKQLTSFGNVLDTLPKDKESINYI